MKLDRHQEPEWMDDPQADAAQLRKSLAFIRSINYWLGYDKVLIRSVDRLTRGIEPDRPLRILDVATGSGDLPAALHGWAQSSGRRLRMSAIDLHALTLRIAREQQGSANQVAFVRADALQLPFADGAFDVATCSMFLHHLRPEQAIAVLREMDRVTSVGIVISDLLRHRRAMFWIRIFTLFSTPMVKHDARASVAAAFSPPEAIDLACQAGLNYLEFEQHFAHRFVLAGKKPTNIPHS